MRMIYSKILLFAADDNRFYTLLQNENSQGFSFVVLE